MKFVVSWRAGRGKMKIEDDAKCQFALYRKNVWLDRYK